MHSIHNQIEEKIKTLKKGSIMFVSDFIELGTAFSLISWDTNVKHHI